MSNKPMEWPYKAKHARDCTAELLLAIINAAEPPLVEDRIFTETEIKARFAKIYAAASKGLRYMESEGAPTRPE